MRAGTLQTGVVSPQAAAPIAKGSLWIIALLLLSISIFGNFITFNGGWQRWNAFDDKGSEALMLAFAWQLVCSVLQFAFLRTKFYPGYLFALAASAIPSIMGYYGPVKPVLDNLCYVLLGFIRGEELRLILANVGAWLAFGIGIFGSDWLPERILVKA